MGYPVYGHFKFAVGDFVQIKRPGKQSMHRSGQVVERLYSECPGGVQLHYAMRLDYISDQIMRFNEIELEPYIEPEK